MKLGEKVVRMPETFRDYGEESRTPRAVAGRVTYIHPKGRFHMVEFETPRRGAAGMLSGGGGPMTQDLCGKCAAELRAAGGEIKRIAGRVDQKVTCARCGRRRYGASFEVKKPPEK